MRDSRIQPRPTFSALRALGTLVVLGSVFSGVFALLVYLRTPPIVVRGVFVLLFVSVLLGGLLIYVRSWWRHANDPRRRPEIGEAGAGPVIYNKSMGWIVFYIALMVGGSAYVIPKIYALAATGNPVAGLLSALALLPFMLFGRASLDLWLARNDRIVVGSKGIVIDQLDGIVIQWEQTEGISHRMVFMGRVLVPHMLIETPRAIHASDARAYRGVVGWLGRRMIGDGIPVSLLLYSGDSKGICEEVRHMWIRYGGLQRVEKFGAAQQSAAGDV